MAIAKLCHRIRRFLPIAAMTGLLQIASVDAQIKLSPGRVPIIDNELNSPIDEPQVIIDEHSSNAVMRATPQHIQHAKDPLVKLVYETREAQRRRLLSTDEHTPWQIMHGMLALREEFLIRHNGQPVSCLEWIQSGPTFENESWFEKTQVRVLTGRGNNYDLKTVGRGHPYNKPYAFEGHINQFVAILSMSGVPLDTQFNTPQGSVTMRDMLTYAKLTVNEKEEVTWTLWALSRYLPSDAEWINAKGEKWSIERLVKIEAGKSLQGAPCGGTHGLFALAHARNVYLRSGKPLVGVWLEAEQKIRRYIQTARMQQNSNGTLSSNYFRGREYKQEFDKRMASSGHLLEFLMMAMPSQELNAPWVRRAIEATSNDLMMNRKSFVSCSPLYHATSALSIYLDRVADAAPNMAQAPSKTHSISNSREIKTADAALTTPVVEHPEAVKTPVMESSGVDSNGAPKTLSEPATAVPEVPATTVPEVPVPEVPATEVPATEVPAVPEKTELPVPAATPAVSLPPATELPAEVPPSEPAPIVDGSSKAKIKIFTAPMPSQSAMVVTPADTNSKVRVFGPQPTPETVVVQLPAVEKLKPSTPVPPVPLPEELLIALPDTEPLPTPVGETTVPVRSVSLPRILPDDKPLPAKEPPQEKKRDGWKATPPERRKPIIVDEKLPDA